MNRRTGTRIAQTTTTALVAAGVIGAVLHGLPQHADVAVRPTVGRDVASWARPLDGYVVPTSELSDQAEDILVAACLRSHGLTDWRVPVRTSAGLQARGDEIDSAARGNPSPSLATTRPLSAADAKTWGYHEPSTAGANQAQWKAWAFDPARTTVIDSLPHGIFDGCLSNARTRLGEPVGGGAQQASEVAERLTYLAALDARRDPAVVARAARWQTCLRAEGLHGVPSSPSDMPTPALRARFGVAVDVRPSTAERRIATADVACQVSSGYRDALYAAEWSRLQRVTPADAAVLAKGSTGNAAYRARLVAVVDGVSAGR